MSAQNRVRQTRILHEAEGYLDLLTVFGDHWKAEPESSDRLAMRALDVLEDLEKQGCDIVGLIYLKGQALRVLHRYEEAVQFLIEAAQQDTNNIDIHLALGWCYKRTSRLDLAIEALEEALAIDPTEAIIHYNLACYWSLTKNVRLSLHYLAKAIELSPSFRDMVYEEKDFDPIRQDPDFQALTSVVV